MSDITTEYRKMLKPDWSSWDFENTDQKKGLPKPDVYKKPENIIETIKLPDPDNKTLSLTECIKSRKSKRKYTDESLTLSELSCLLWITAGVREDLGEGRVFRTFPSAGNRQSIDTYIYADRVEGLKKGIYKYAPLEHELLLLDQSETLKEDVKATANYYNSQVLFIFTAIPYRMEYRYTTVSHKMIAIEAGHVCQNLSLAAEAIGLGALAIAAYSQEKADKLLNLDGEEEFVIYLGSAGK